MGRIGKTKYESRKKSHKIELCNDFFNRIKSSDTFISRRKFCLEKKIAESTFQGWCNEYILLTSDTNGNKIRTKPAEFPVVEEQVYKWFVKFKDAGHTCYCAVGRYNKPETKKTTIKIKIPKLINF